jgi:hypothetical protein
MALSSKRLYKDAKTGPKRASVEWGAVTSLIRFSLWERPMSEFDEGNMEQSSNWSIDADDTHSIAGRARVRSQLQQDVEAFLSQGGRIQEVDTTFRSNVSRKVDVGFNNRAL